MDLPYEVSWMQFYSSKNSQNLFDHILWLKKKNSIFAYIEKSKITQLGNWNPLFY